MSITKPHNLAEETLAVVIGLVALLALAIVGLFIPKVRAYNRRMSVESTYHHDE